MTRRNIVKKKLTRWVQSGVNMINRFATTQEGKIPMPKKYCAKFADAWLRVNYKHCRGYRMRDFEDAWSGECTKEHQKYYAYVNRPHKNLRKYDRKTNRSSNIHRDSNIPMEP